MCPRDPRIRRSGAERNSRRAPSRGGGAPTLSPPQAKRGRADRGNVFFERFFAQTTLLWGSVPFETIERAIIEPGVERPILPPDRGQPSTPPPAEGLRLYAERLRSTG